MSSEQEQIILSYEKLGMTPAQIAEDRPPLSVETVKAALMAGSARYRKDCGVEDVMVANGGKKELNFTDEEQERIQRRIVDIALGSENELVALKACIYVNDDKKGRNDLGKAIGGKGMNVLIFNQQMQRVNELVYGGSKVTDV